MGGDGDGRAGPGGDAAGRHAWKIGLAAASPVTTFLLLRYVSGVPLSEAAAKRRYGGQRAYRKYASKTPMLVPRLF